MSTDSKTYQVPADIAANALVNKERYQSLYQQSISDPDSFWAEQAESFLTWDQPWQTIRAFDFAQGQASWFSGAKLNVTTNCIDRHLPARAEQTAIIWEGDEPNDDKTITYGELHTAVCKLANVLKQRGVKKGDRVCIYMPMIPEAAYAMLACARIGAVHSVVFGGFSPDSLKDRILDSDCRCVITADEGVRGGKKIPLKQNTDKALANCPNVNTCIVVQRTGGEIDWQQERDVWYHQAVEQVADTCKPESMDAEDPLFILYTSGSTGKPKGVLHTTAGYLLQAAMSHKYTFDYHDGDVYWCTADVGWVTGHTYIVYGPLANGGITLMFEGVPNYPSASRCWDVVDKHQVKTFYTAPTAIRALMAAGDEFVTRTSRKSLKIIGTVGEPINPEAWEWYYRVVGESRCPIVDTWWQTETGGHMLTPLVTSDLKPGSATRPFFGVQPVLLDKNGQKQHGEAQGNLCISDSWPGQMRGIYNNPERFEKTYFSDFDGYYFTGDGARRDEDGDYWITGRVDDVLNVSGHRMGTAEIESAINEHKHVAESAVVGIPHAIKGEAIFAYVTLMAGHKVDETELRAEIIKNVRTIIGAIATPEIILLAPALPKTRSGKIMRRILRKIATNEFEDLGDTSTLADSSVINTLILAKRKAA